MAATDAATGLAGDSATAAVRNGRRFAGFEDNRDCVALAWRRIERALAEGARVRDGP